MSQRVAEILAKWKFDPASTNASVGEINKLNDALDATYATGASLSEVLANPEMAKQLGLDAQMVAALNEQLGVTVATATEVQKSLNGMENAKSGLLGNLQGNSEAQAARGFARELLQIQNDEAKARGENLNLARQLTNEMQEQLTTAEQAARLQQGAITSRLNGMNGVPLINSTRETADSFVGGLRADMNAPANGAVGRNIYRAGREMFMLPNVNLPGGISSTDVSRGLMLTGGVAERANVSLGKLIGTMAIWGGALAIAGVAIALVVNKLNEASEAERRRFEMIAQTSKEVVEDSTVELQIRRANAMQANALEQENHERLLARQQELQDTLAAGFSNSPEARAQRAAGQGVGADAPFAETLTQLGANATALQASEKALEENTKNIDAYTAALEDNYEAAGQVIAVLNQQTQLVQKQAQLSRSSDVSGTQAQITGFVDEVRALGSQATLLEREISTARAEGNVVTEATLQVELVRVKAALDQAAANEHLYQSMIPVIEANAALEETNRQHVAYVEAETQALIGLDSLTKKDREDRVKEINREIAIRIQQQAQLEAGTAAFIQMGDAIAALQVEANLLIHAGESSADRAAQAQAVSDMYDELWEAEDSLAEAREKQLALEQELTDALNAHTEKVEAIDAELKDRQIKAEEERAKNEREARAKSAKQLATDLEDIQRRSDRRIAEIKAEGTKKLEELIAKGDQAGAIQALADQAFQIEQEEKRRAQAEEDRTRESTTQLEDELARIQASYEEQLAAADEAHRLALEQENKRWAKEEALRRDAIAKQIAQVQNAARNVDAIQDNMISLGLFKEQYWANSRLSILENSAAEIENEWYRMLNSMQNAVSGSSGGGTVPPPSDPGGMPPSNPNPTGFVPLGAPANPTRGQTYKDPFNDWWVYNGTSWQRAYTAGTQAAQQSVGSGFAGLAAGETGFSAGRTGSGGGVGGASNVDDHSNVNINIYTTSSMDEEKVVKLARQEFNVQKPALKQEISGDMARIQLNQQRNGGRR